MDMAQRDPVEKAVRARPAHKRDEQMHGRWRRPSKREGGSAQKSADSTY